LIPRSLHPTDSIYNARVSGYCAGKRKWLDARRLVCVALSMASVLAPLSATAAIPVDYVAPASCPDAAAFEAEVVRRLRRAPTADDLRPHRFSVRLSEQD
jgi:hypothetical protein